jgi:hypothetical protein
MAASALVGGGGKIRLLNTSTPPSWQPGSAMTGAAQME